MTDAARVDEFTAQYRQSCCNTAHQVIESRNLAC